VASIIACAKHGRDRPSIADSILTSVKILLSLHRSPRDVGSNRKRCIKHALPPPSQADEMPLNATGKGT
jgi:hypothetical protein